MVGTGAREAALFLYVRYRECLYVAGCFVLYHALLGGFLRMPSLDSYGAALARLACLTGAGPAHYF